METPTKKPPPDPKAKRRVRIAFFLLFAFAAVGLYVAIDLGRLRDLVAARESRAALQGITDIKQVDAALAQHPQNKFLRMTAMATRALDETNGKLEKLAGELEPPAIAKVGDLRAASRNDLEALRRDLNTAMSNAASGPQRVAAILKAERDDIEKFATSLQLSKTATKRLLDQIDARHAEITAFASKMLSARADYYRAYQNYVGVLVGEFGAYQVVSGQFVFALPRTVERYNAAAQAMATAAKPLPELDQEQERLLQSQRADWLKFVRSE